ncbi:MAG: sulfatase [Acidobacteriota bacterium]
MRLHALALMALAALTSCASCSKDTGGSRRINVLLISLDSTRRDLLSIYGRRPAHAPERSTCPHLAKLADEGVIIEQAYATSSWTLPSHISLLTGEPELVHGVDVDYQRPDPVRPLIAEVLHSHGYSTAGFFSGPYLEPHFGFGRGFDRYEARYGPEILQASHQSAIAREQLREAERARDPARLRAALQAAHQATKRVETLSHRDVSSAAVTEGVLEELQRAAGDLRPFFIFAHYFDPHHDYAPPPPYDRAFDAEYSGDMDSFDWIRNPRVAGFDPNRMGIRTRVISDRDLEHIQALYEGELAWTDAQIGRALDELHVLGLSDNTLVIVTADHGDEFFEHEAIGHRRTLFEEVTQIPLILRLPGRLPEGVRIKGLVSIADVVPTILDLLGLPAMGDLSSRSFLPLIDGGEDDTERHVIGRLVRTYNRMLHCQADDGSSMEIPGQQIDLIETWHQGSLKLKRERVWPVAVVEPPPAVVDFLANLREKHHQQETLTWIDLAAHPGERPADWSPNFHDPRALAALRAFHDAYRDLLARRGHVDVADNKQLLDRLRGLGYVGGGGELMASGEFILPPPGDSLLLELVR